MEMEAEPLVAEDCPAPQSKPLEQLIGSGAKKPWSESKRAFHAAACKDKEKLSLGQKLDIVQRATAMADSERYRTQAQLAKMFNKSRSAISKILRPENIKKLKQVAATGMHPDVKRHSWRDFSDAFLELEKRVHQYVLAAKQDDKGNPCSTQVCQYAEELAKEIGVTNFRGTYGWFTRFMRRHGLSADMKEHDARVTSPYYGYGHAPISSTPSRSTLLAIDISSNGSLGSIDSRASTLPEASHHMPEGAEYWHPHEFFPAAAHHPCHVAETPHQDYYEAMDNYDGAAHRRHVEAGLAAMFNPQDLYMFSNLCRVMVNVKVLFHTPASPTKIGKMLRRVRVALPVDPYGNPVRGFDILYAAVTTAFRTDIANAALCDLRGIPRITYVDEDGDHIAIDNDGELGVALHYCGNNLSPDADELTLRLQLSLYINY